ncbi:unnamed protein product, partial [Mesorhabditis belari]|uniref:MIR domain-containing protein n=1 Tax=Mesorhabditis belari TaxID=2138241 RepID=A0AAF3EFJ4_9BILA
MRQLLVFATILFITNANTDVITCGSVLKLQNQGDNTRLHSHDVKYGSGSGQQSVTAVQNSDDHNSHWQLLGAYGETCPRGTGIKCGSLIRFKHLSTGCFLHSHHFQGPLSKNLQEVSCFGSAAHGDTGDNWEVVCSHEHWEESDPIKLRHKDTGVYLALSGQVFGRPIHGQREVIGTTNTNSMSHWLAAEGVYMDLKDQ